MVNNMEKIIQERYRKPVDEFVRKALERYEKKIDSIILFGSVARGEGKEDSDVDILVVGDVSLDELVNVSFPILLEHGKLISAKNMKREHFDFLVREGYSFARNILREGITLYEGMGEAFGESGREAKISKYSVWK
jgi:hypothetical protein